jgi:hypothetical protein
MAAKSRMPGFFRWLLVKDQRFGISVWERTKGMGWEEKVDELEQNKAKSHKENLQIASQFGFPLPSFRQHRRLSLTEFLQM